MKLTVKEYCDKKNMQPRYIQQLIKEGEIELLKRNWGITDFKKYGNTYILNIKKGYFDKDK